jgi:lantibiotic biosynthesis protein
MNNPYLPFNRFVFRSPLLSFNIFCNYLKEILSSEESFKQLLSNQIIQEAIYLASPVLFEELQKFILTGLSDKKEKEKERFKYSMVRYLSRMSTRCTPFGLFAGCSIGQLSDSTNITLLPLKSNKRHTRLDMNYLCELAQDSLKLKGVKHQIHYYRNNSVYKLGDKLRYIESFYKETKQMHQIATVDNSEYLEKIMQKALKGAKFNELVNLLVNDEINVKDASLFIEEIIASQLLVSDLEPTVTGQEFIYQILQKLEILIKNFGDNETLINFNKRLNYINTLLAKIDDSPIGTTLYMYKPIVNEIKELGTKFEAKYLFQTDMIKPVESAILNKNIINDDILKAIEFLNKLSIPQGETILMKFLEAFKERYEEKEMPLMQVLDNETGIGYGPSRGDINSLTDDLSLPQKMNNNESIPWNKIHAVILKKYLETVSEKNYILELSDKDFDDIKIYWDDLPSTISVMCSVIKDDDEGREIYLKSAGGTSAANLLGRFCHADQLIEEHVLEITRKEEELNSEVIYAEIAHLPESRIGNIVSRPILRTYEIPFLAASAVSEENRIEVSDLMISVHKGRILLRSKRLNKEIVPRLATAHNYRQKALPVYHFLCDMQLQNRRGGLFFQWGHVFNEYDWLPRVKYKNVILSLARWTVKQVEIKIFIELKNDKELVDSITKWRQGRQIPNFVVLDDGDNELFVDLRNALSLRTLFSVVKKRPVFHLEEFLFNPNHAIVKSNEGAFTNEFLFSFYKNN